jgi:hypothetical protein
MADWQGRVVGEGSTPPIMITDDHKSTKPTSQPNLQAASGVAEHSAKRKRKSDSPRNHSDDDADDDSAPQDTNENTAKRRAKNANSSIRPPPTEPSQRANASLATPAPASVFSTAPSSPRSAYSSPPPQQTLTGTSLQTPTFFPNPLASPQDDGLGELQLDLVMASLGPTVISPAIPLSPTAPAPVTHQSPPQFPVSVPPVFVTSPPPVPYDFTRLPQIHRLIPSSGPTQGGIEVTILGSNFVPGLQCLFGDSLASSTQLWSENTLVCLLPPSPTAGPAVVSFKNAPFDTTHLHFFNYLDNSDRVL